MRLKDWLKDNRQFFLERDLRYLIKNTFAPQSWHIFDEEVDAAGVEYLQSVTASYMKGFPMPYLLGKEDFFGLEFKVNPSVLIPRKETELIVEKALEILRRGQCRSVLDLGCGSGNIAVTIKKTIPWARVTASDCDEKALEIAQCNVSFHDVHVTFARSDVFSGFQKASFDMIVTNPPYVDADDMTSELSYEPRTALVAGDKGFSMIERILNEAHNYLRPQGYLLIEMGYNHKELVYNKCVQSGMYSIIEWIKDYDGNWRGAVMQVKKQ